MILLLRGRESCVYCVFVIEKNKQKCSIYVILYYSLIHSMVKNSMDLDYAYQRKKSQSKWETKKRSLVAFFDKIIYPIWLIWPFMLLPQIIKIYSEQDASSIALSSRVLFLVVWCCRLFYWVVHKQNALIISNIAWIVWYCFMIWWKILY